MTQQLDPATEWAQAVQLHHALASGASLSSPVAPPVPGLIPEPGEFAVAVFSNSTKAVWGYERYSATNVTYRIPFPVVIPLAGTATHVAAGILLGQTLARARLRRRANRIAAPQWRPATVTYVVVTTRRLQVETANQTWLTFDYDTITDLHLASWSLTLTFRQAEPLRLTGLSIPRCATVVAHYRFGRALAASHPGLLPLHQGRPLLRPLTAERPPTSHTDDWYKSLGAVTRRR